MNALRIGVLGCADIAWRRMLPATRTVPGVEIAAAASRDAAKAARFAGEFGCDAVRGYAALLDRDDVAAVYVPLPASMHAEWIEAALRAGKHVLAEKPVTLEPARTRKLLELAADAGLVLMENVMFVHHAQHEAVRRLVADGAIGEVRAFQAAFAIPRLPDDDIRYDPDLGGGALWDVGIYPVRASLHFLGPDLTVVGAVLTQGEGRKVDTAGAALLRTPGGVGAQLTFGLEHAYASAYTLWGGEGRITVDRAFTPPADHRPTIRLERRGGVEEIHIPPDDQVANTVRAFAEAVRTGRAPGTAEAVRQITLLEEIRQLGRAGSSVSSSRLGP